jgi:phosphatidylglycerol:prolipoprotein diacylglycerol transferase
VRTYGLSLAVAFLIGTWLGLKEARRLKLDPDALISVVLVTLVSSILGARLLYVVEHINEFRDDWASVLALWHGGLTLYGGLAAGTIGGLLAARRFGLPMWTVADALTPSLALGTAIGRVGCFLNGCCYGHPTNLPWGVVYPPDTFPSLEFGTQPLHPAQLYFALFGAALFALFWLLRKRPDPPGVHFWTFVCIYGLGRVFLDLTRAYEPSAQVLMLGNVSVSESQLMSLALTLFALLMIHRRLRASRTTIAAPAVPA